MMSNKEFFKTIQNMDVSSLTKDEIFEIGKRYREVIDKNWNELAAFLGWSTGENLRTFVKNRMKAKGELASRVTSASLDYDEDTRTELDVKLAQLYKEKTKNRDILNSYRRGLRDDARIAELKECILEAARMQKELGTIEYKPVKSEASFTEAVLLLSDLHIGVKCQNSYNTFNSKVAAERLAKLASRTIQLCKRNNVSLLNILNLGDLISGNIHVTGRIEEEMDIISQIMTASELISQFLYDICKSGIKVKYRSVVDNHSRATANYKEHIEKENFAKLIDWYLIERLKNVPDWSIEFIQDNLDDGLGLFKLRNGKLLGFAHGHQDNINTVFQNWVGATKQFIDFMCLGHYHCEKIKSYQGARVIVNGSIVGTEQYAYSKRLFSEPSQVLLIFEDNDILMNSINLQ